METFSYEGLNLYNGLRSPTGTVTNDEATRYYMRALYDRILSVFSFDLPDHWNYDYFTNVLLCHGYIGIFDSPKYGIIPQICAVSGYGLWLQPTDLIISQPLVNFSGKIGTNCEIIKLTRDYTGVTDIVYHYAVMLSQAFTSLKTALVNCRAAFLLAAKDKAAAETLKVIYEKISAGEPAIVFDKKLQATGLDGQDSIFDLSYNPKDFYMVTDLLADIATIVNQFDREIGIPSVDAKKERFIQAEVDALTADHAARLTSWTKELKDSIKNVKKLYPDIKISFRTIAEKDGDQNAPDIDRNV